MALPSPSRPRFEADGVPAPPAPSGSSPAQSSSLGALVRFEFEAGRGNEGTKILMVEWEEDDSAQEGAAGTSGSGWEVSWEGKTTLLSARDGAEDRLHRIYFLLGPGISIPPVVKLVRKVEAGGSGGSSGSSAAAGITAAPALEVKPLPAIFPAELGLRGTAAGKRGILHTRYAKQRLAALQDEIEREMRTNGEGIGLEIAMQEKQWLEDNFGVCPRTDAHASLHHHNHLPASPKTPGAGRLAERLKGLKLGTSVSELSGSSGDPSPSKYSSSSSSHPLSPETGDVAVSSFSLFHSSAPRRAVAQSPPDHLITAQQLKQGRIGSLDEELAAAAPAPVPAAHRRDDEDELFAVKMSPRSPEMTKSPFSFSARHTAL